MADNVERLLADVDTEDCDLVLTVLDMGVLHSLQPQTQRRVLAEQEHGCTIPREVKRFCPPAAAPCA